LHIEIVARADFEAYNFIIKVKLACEVEVSDWQVDGLN
jgi:hypothetical protein